MKGYDKQLQIVDEARKKVTEALKDPDLCTDEEFIDLVVELAVEKARLDVKDK